MVLTGKTRATKADGVWVQPDALDTQALPTVMKKVIAFALGGIPARGVAIASSRHFGHHRRRREEEE